MCLGTEDSEPGRFLCRTGQTQQCACGAVVGSGSWRLRQRLLGCAEKLDEVLAAAAEPTLRPDIADADSRAATVKQRPTSRRITPAEISVSRLGGGAWAVGSNAGRGTFWGGGPSFVPHSRSPGVLVKDPQPLLETLGAISPLNAHSWTCVEFSLLWLWLSVPPA